MATASDDFSSQGDSDLSDDTDWAVDEGAGWITCIVSSGHVQGKNSDGEHWMYWTGGFGAGDHYSQAVMTGNDWGVSVKNGTGATSDDFYLCYGSLSTQVQFYEFNNGGGTLKDTSSISSVSGTPIKITYESGVVKAYRDDVEIAGFTFSDTTHSGNQYVGMGVYSNAAGDQVDDWEGGDIGGAATPNQTQSIIMGWMKTFALGHPILAAGITGLVAIIKRRMRLMK